MTTKGTILVTGANGGLGVAIVRQFLKSPHAAAYRGIYTVRAVGQGTRELERALQQQQQSSTKHHPESEVLGLDLSRLDEVRRVAADINARVAGGTLGPLRAVILNAAFQEANDSTLSPQRFTTSAAGGLVEANFAINYLANFLLVLLLLPSLDRAWGRIVFVSSFAHDPLDPRNASQKVYAGDQFHVMYPDTDSLVRGITYVDDGRKAGVTAAYRAGMRRYGASKSLLVMFMYELQRRLDTDPVLSHISTISLDPGAMGGTGITKNSPAWIRFLTTWLLPLLEGLAVRFRPNGMLRPTWKSADDLLLACFDTAAYGDTPRALFLNGTQLALSSRESRDEDKQRRLWTDSLTLAGLQEGDTILRDWQ